MNWGWKSSSSISRHWPRFELAGRMLAFVLVCWRMSSGSCGNSREQLVRLRGLCTQMWHIDCRLSDLVCQCIAFSPTWNCTSNGSDSMRHCHRQLSVLLRTRWFFLVLLHLIQCWFYVQWFRCKFTLFKQLFFTANFIDVLFKNLHFNQCNHHT